MAARGCLAGCGGQRIWLRSAAARMAALSTTVLDSAIPKPGQARTKVTNPSGGSGATHSAQPQLKLPLVELAMTLQRRVATMCA